MLFAKIDQITKGVFSSKGGLASADGDPDPNGPTQQGRGRVGTGLQNIGLIDLVFLKLFLGVRDIF